MRILQIISQSRVGGAETVGVALATGLAQRGHATLLLANRANGPLLDRPHPPGMEAAGLPRTSRLDPRIVPFLIRNAARFHPDVIHSHGYEASVWGRLLGLLHPQAVVLHHVHSSRFVDHHPRHRIWTDRLLGRRTDAVLTVNDIQHDYLARTVRIPAHKIHMVPNGIDLAAFAPPGDSRVPRSAVCVASLTDVKNHAGLLRAWSQVRRQIPGACLTLVGDGPLRRQLQEQADSAGIGQHVRFAGLQTDVRPFLWEAQVFVLFSHLEALPLSLLEAMAAGCACVVSAVGGMPGVIASGETGLSVPGGDEAALVTALIRLLSRDTEREVLAARGHEEVARRFSSEVWMDRILAIIHESLQRRRSQRDRR